jgi:uncharacterized protein YbaA (DUF1428 family)
VTLPGFEDGAGLAGLFVWRVLCGLRLAPRAALAMWADRRSPTAARLKPDINPMPFDGKRLIFGGFEMIGEA